MVKLNHHFQKLSDESLATEMEKRISSVKSRSPHAALIHLGRSDLTQPLPPTSVQALVAAAQEMGEKATFRGYGPFAGYDFLRQAIASHDYANLKISPEEIFISDGAKSDIGNLQEIFSTDNKIALPDPCYPTYLEANILSGRTRLPLKTGRFGGVVYLECTEENGFLPRPPGTHVDLIYLCSPSNPTGVAMDRSSLKEWVDYAKEHEALLLFDGTYEAYITSDAPRSIYEIEGAKETAIEIRSYSKSAGFTGLRCSYLVIPRQIKVRDVGKTHSLNSLWKRRCEMKSNGVSYPVQRAAASLYTPQGQKEKQEILQSYSEKARFLRDGLSHLGFAVYGGIDSPYVWCKAPEKMDAWQFFDHLLEKTHLVVVPGQGFGSLGTRFVRFSAFAEQTELAEALLRMKSL